MAGILPAGPGLGATKLLMSPINTNLSAEAWRSLMSEARKLGRRERPKRAHARCEGCHRVVLLPEGDENTINPDWWFCEECRREGSAEYDEEGW